MDTLSFNVDFADTNEQIEKKILKAIVSELNTRLGRIKRRVGQTLKEQVRTAIKSSPEYRSISGLDSRFKGGLDGAFGFQDGQQRIDNIIAVWLDSIGVFVKNAKIRGNQIEAGLNIRGIESDYSKVLNMEEAISVTYKGQRLPWLEWLLLHGSSQIIDGWKIVYNRFPDPPSRSKKALMIEKAGSGWGVPVEFKGTQGDNFLTRALNTFTPNFKENIQQIIIDELTK